MAQQSFRILLAGIVQGLGLRSFIYNLAQELNLFGWVSNSTQGVLIEAEGNSFQLDLFLKKIKRASLLKNKVENLKVEEINPVGYQDFSIKESVFSGSNFLSLTPDLPICKDCRKELFHKRNRRYEYPFINCSHCGPRFSIIKDLNYDRSSTTMSDFLMCDDCAREYTLASDRRFNLQLNSCHKCGPKLKLFDSQGKVLDGLDPVMTLSRALVKGKIVVVKDLSGFYLFCDTQNFNAVERLRDKIGLLSKPFNLLVKDMSLLKRIAVVEEKSASILESVARPVLILPKQKRTPLAKNVIFDHLKVAVQLPATALMELIFQKSGLNSLISFPIKFEGEHLPFDDESLRENLKDVFDLFLTHNLRMKYPLEDSVILPVLDKTLFLRRAKGYVPEEIKLQKKITKPILACGAQESNTFCFLKDNKAFVSQPLGDFKTYRSLNYFSETIDNFKEIFGIDPEVIAYDLHPIYLTSEYALRQQSKQLLAVQHHHAHVVSVMAENGLEKQVMGVVLDEGGYGADGAQWGFEFLISDLKSYERVGQLNSLKAVFAPEPHDQETYLALSLLYDTFGEEMFNLGLGLYDRLDPLVLESFLPLRKEGVSLLLDSSAGMFFAAVSSLLGVLEGDFYRHHELLEIEKVATYSRVKRASYNFEILSQDGRLVIDYRKMVRSMVSDMLSLRPLSMIAAKFHHTLVEMVTENCLKIKELKDINQVVLAGGVLRNQFLTTNLLKRLKELGFEVFLPQKMAVGDGGISLGQAVIAGALTESLPNLPGIDMWLLRPQSKN